MPSHANITRLSVPQTPHSDLLGAMANVGAGGLVWRMAGEPNIPAGYLDDPTHGVNCWSEDVAYEISWKLHAEIGKASRCLHAMCLSVVEEAMTNDALMARLHIPRPAMEFVRQSWKDRDPFFIGRFDFAILDGIPKMLEYNADTPEGVIESSLFQNIWAVQNASWLPSCGDGYSPLADNIISWVAELIDTQRIWKTDGSISSSLMSAYGLNPRPIFVAGRPIRLKESDAAHSEMLACLIRRAIAMTRTTLGAVVLKIDIQALGLDSGGSFLHPINIGDDSSQGVPIKCLVRSYPWEQMFDDIDAAGMSKANCRFLSPPWTSLISTKAILPVLYEKWGRCPYLLPAEDGHNTPSALTEYVTKPVHSRGGDNISIFKDAGRKTASTDGDYDYKPVIRQQFVDTRIGGHYTTASGWIVGNGIFSGLAFRESGDPIARDYSTMVPWYLRDGPPSAP